MHGTALSTADSRLFSEQLSHDLSAITQIKEGSTIAVYQRCRNSFTERMDVISVSGTYVIILIQTRDHSCGHSLLTRIQMNEATHSVLERDPSVGFLDSIPKHLSSVVHFCAFLFELSPEVHVFVKSLGELRGDLLLRVLFDFC